MTVVSGKLTAPWISHVCNRQQVSCALLEIFMCTSDTCTMSFNSCVLYYIHCNKILRNTNKNHFIPFEITNFTNAYRLATFLACFIIKTSGSESRGQEEAACMRIIRPIRDHYRELFTRMVAVNF